MGSHECADEVARSQQAQFYKTFTRPVAKVLLIAVLTYQLAYFTWSKLEADELRGEADGTFPILRNNMEPSQHRNLQNGADVGGAETLKGLEAKVEEYKSKAAPKKP